jgi:hypothetical protein
MFFFKIRKTIPSEFRIKIKRGETGERPMSRRTERAKPHHENMKTHRGPITLTQDFENWDNFWIDECAGRDGRVYELETPRDSTSI